MRGATWRRRVGLFAVGVVSLASSSTPATGFRGWAGLIDQLVADGVARPWAERVFRDRRMPAFVELDYSLVPGEPRSIYASFLRSKSIAAARTCKRNHRKAFERASRAHGVDSSVIAAIIYVETRCGGYTGNHRVLYRVARLAMANDPANLNRNINRHLEKPGKRSPDEVVALARTRAAYLNERFYPEVRAVFTIAERLGIDPLEIRGSGAGAFGLPQFLPSSYLKFAVDGNGDGRVSLFNPDDAIASCANYLAKHGWKQGLSTAERRRVLWQYNKSDPYIDTVLALAARIRGA